MRKNITVTAKHTPEGLVIPVSFIWSDGREFQIDKILDSRPCASLKSGGIGIRYHCLVKGKDVYLFDEFGVWFFESTN